MTCLRIICVLAVTMVLTAVADKVGDSLSLEGRAAVIRAASWLTEQQAVDGSWSADAALTGIAGKAIAEAADICDSDILEGSLGRAVAYLRRVVPSCHGITAAQAIRLFMRLGGRDDQLQIERVRTELLLSKDLQEKYLPWILDCTRTLPSSAGGRSGSSAAVQLAVALATNDYAESSLKLLVAAVRHSDWRQLPLEDSYWSARALQAVCSAGVMPYDGWKTDILVALLERQRGNGAWSDSVRDSALAIETVLLCLLD